VAVHEQFSVPQQLFRRELGQGGMAGFLEPPGAEVLDGDRIKVGRNCSGGEPAKHAKYAKRLQELHAQSLGCFACFACFAG
jgi:hypothetical protein